MKYERQMRGNRKTENDERKNEKVKEKEKKRESHCVGGKVSEGVK